MRYPLALSGAALVFSLAAATCPAEHHESSPSPTPAAERLWHIDGLPAPESALYDAATGNIYVSVIDGGPMEKNGTGRIAVVSPAGTLLNPALVDGLNAPKGMALHEGRLYVTDIDELIVIDIAKAQVVERHAAPESKFLNDVAADAQGRIYVSDKIGNALYRLADGEFRRWNTDTALEYPNGLLVDGDTLILATWGPITEGFSTSAPGRLLRLDPATGAITELPGTSRLGNLDGVERLQDGRLVVTDWMVGKVFVVGADGQATEVLDLGQGAADLGVITEQNVLLIPHMMENRLEAWRLH